MIEANPVLWVTMHHKENGINFKIKEGKIEVKFTTDSDKVKIRSQLEEDEAFIYFETKKD